MNTRLFISNLPYEIDSAELDAIIEQNGHKASEVKVITDKESGRSRGFAFAEFGTAAAAKAAMGVLNGLAVGARGRPLRVDFAKEREGGGGGGGGHRHHGGGGGGGGRGGDRGRRRDDDRY